MSLILKNEFIFTDDVGVLKRLGDGFRVNVATSAPNLFANLPNVTVYKWVKEGDTLSGNIYLDSLDMDEAFILECFDYCIDNDLPIMVRACDNLYTAGVIEARYGLSPIMFLHKNGILKNAIIIGGVHLDKDDIAAMAQENARVVITPSRDMFKGNGIAPFSALSGKVEVSLGTDDGQYNALHSLVKEVYLLRAAVSASMSKENAISYDRLFDIVVSSGNITDFKKLFLS